MRAHSSRLKLWFGRLLLWWWRRSAPRCHCGRPLHYRSAAVRRMVERQIQERGPTVRVTVAERTWLVPRHYIALHGLKAWELDRLGFHEVLESRALQLLRRSRGGDAT